MRKLVLATCLVAALVGGMAPAVALAGGGGSAGDNQYVDPLSGQKSHHSSSHPAPTTTTAPVTPAPTTSAPPPTTSTATSAPPVTAPTATSATSSPSTTLTARAHDPSGKHKTLPFTGLNIGVAAVVGAVMFATGVLLRHTLPSA